MKDYIFMLLEIWLIFMICAVIYAITSFVREETTLRYQQNIEESYEEVQA